MPVPPSREIEVIVVPPGSMFELPPPEPTTKRADANTKADTEARIDAKANAKAGAKSNAKAGGETMASAKSDAGPKPKAKASAKLDAGTKPKASAKRDAMAEDAGSDRAESFPDLDFTVTAESSADDPSSGVHAATKSGPRNSTKSGPRNAPTSGSRDAPSAGPRDTGSSRPATRAAGAASTTDASALAPRKRRSVAWLILLMIALGGGAMATAYFWPDLSVALGLDEP